MYTSINFKTKKAFKQAVSDYLESLALQHAGIDAVEFKPVTLWAPGIGTPKANGTEYVEGPHYPKPHTWYAEVEVKDGIVVRVK